MMIILGMTWKEMLRKRVMTLTLLMTAIFLGAFWFVAKTLQIKTGADIFNANNSNVLISQFTRGAFILMLGFFFGSFVIAFLSIFSSFASIAGEAEQGVLQAILPRPLPRWKWYIGRWLGYVTLGVVYAFILFTAILVITSFHANVPRDMVALSQAFLLFASVVPLLITVSMLGSGMFSLLGNGVFMTMLYGAGWLGGMIDKVGGNLPLEPDVSASLTNISGLMSLVMPADALQRKMLDVLLGLDELQGIVPVGRSSFDLIGLNHIPSVSFVVYALIYTLAAFVLGIYRFQRKDL